MPVILATSRHIPLPNEYDLWCVITGSRDFLEVSKRVPGLASQLEIAYEAIREEWISLASVFKDEGSIASSSHTSSCNTNASDFGTMLAWSVLYKKWEAATETTLFICNDPWMYRHLASIGGQCHGNAPILIFANLKLFIRGYIARVYYALRAIYAKLITNIDVLSCPIGSVAILTYGHPKSVVEGYDGYFGSLMSWEEKLTRIIHVDCPISRFQSIAKDGRSFSLHSWGSLSFALTLPFRIWRWGPSARSGRNFWLVRRIVARENSTAQIAAISWQKHCQEKWIKIQRPRTILWPWENQSWERSMVTEGRQNGARTFGYQHTVVGRRHWVHLPVNSSKNEDTLPELIICSGPVWMSALENYGIPRERMELGGALRFTGLNAVNRDPRGPVFVALPFMHSIAGQIYRAIRCLAKEGRYEFLVSTHPMNPYQLKNQRGITYTQNSLADQDGISAVIYASTTVGLEALIAGLPVVRFVPEGSIAVDVMPEGLNVAYADAINLGDILERTISKDVKRVSATEFFQPPKRKYWAKIVS